jgi:hypothetical protein
MLQMACEKSLEESEEQMQRVMESRRKVSEQLSKLNLERLETPKDGNCQFIALAFAAGVPLTHDVLRLAVHGNHFRALDRATFACDYSSYVDEMSKSGTYGDDITLMAAAALFLRPVRVVGPDAEAHEGIRKFNPPSNVSVEAWGHPIVLGFVDWCHYEATCPLESRPPLKAEPR